MIILMVRVCSKMEKYLPGKLWGTVRGARPLPNGPAPLRAWSTFSLRATVCLTPVHLLPPNLDGVQPASNTYICIYVYITSHGFCVTPF